MGGSNKVVYVGLASDVIIAITKLVVAAITGSSAMLAEGFHSIVDSGNAGLLWLGLHRSKQPASHQHPFGHGLELYFWSFVVAVSMFAVGGVLSIWEGIKHMLHPEAVTNAIWTYVVLGIAVALSVASFVVALREINRRRGEAGIIEFIRRSKDPTVFTMVLADAADIIGAVVAALAIFLSLELHDPRIDGAGSIAVGIVILAVSVVLANECRGLLVGEAAPEKDVERMKQLLAEDPGVDRVGDLLTMQLGPNVILLNVNVDFKEHHSIGELEKTIDRLEERVRKQYPAVQHLFVEAESIREEQEKHKKAS